MPKENSTAPSASGTVPAFLRRAAASRNTMAAHRVSPGYAPTNEGRSARYRLDARPRATASRTSPRYVGRERGITGSTRRWKSTSSARELTASEWPPEPVRSGAPAEGETDRRSGSRVQPNQRTPGAWLRIRRLRPFAGMRPTGRGPVFPARAIESRRARFRGFTRRSGPRIPGGPFHRDMPGGGRASTVAVPRATGERELRLPGEPG